MALVEVHFASTTLHHGTTYWAVVPAEGAPKPLRTLYLLHGVGGDETSWLVHSRVADVATAHGIAIILPPGGHSFYLDREGAFEWTGAFIGRELVEHTRSLFPLSPRREDTWIGGLSMGGYGALRNGFKYRGTFGAVAALSSALAPYWAADASETAAWPFARRSYLRAVFGDLAALPGSDADMEALASQAAADADRAPRVFLACGTEDSLLATNRRFRDHLLRIGLPHEYVERPGQHDWVFWDGILDDVVTWLAG